MYLGGLPTKRFLETWHKKQRQHDKRLLSWLRKQSLRLMILSALMPSIGLANQTVTNDAPTCEQVLDSCRTAVAAQEKAISGLFEALEKSNLERQLEADRADRAQRTADRYKYVAGASVLVTIVVVGAVALSGTKTFLNK